MNDFLDKRKDEVTKVAMNKILRLNGVAELDMTVLLTISDEIEKAYLDGTIDAIDEVVDLAC